MLNSKLLRVLAAPLATLLTLSCILSSKPGCPPATLSPDVSLTVEPRSDNALIADATVQLRSPAPVYLEFGTPQLGWLRTRTAEASSTHRLPLVRMRAQTTYQVRAFVPGDGGCAAAAAQAEITTDDLPDVFKSLGLSASGSPTSPLTLMDLHFISHNGRHALLALDQDVQPVWYYQVSRRVLRDAPDSIAGTVIQLTNGNLMYLLDYFGLEEITPDTRLVRRILVPGSRVHHDLLELPDGRVLLLGGEVRQIDDRPNGGPPNMPLRADTLLVLTPETGAVEKVWSLFDTLDPLRRSSDWAGWRLEDADDWAHANSLSWGSRGNLLVSLRNLNQVLSLSPDFRTLEWRLGGEDSSFAFPDHGDRFYGQHSVSELPNGHLIMFDNGNFRPDGDYSRALEIALDPATMTARKVWEFRHDADVYADRVSNAVRLSNGNTLVNFGFRGDGPSEPLVLTEARPDGKVAWELTARVKGARLTRYRSWPLTSIAGEMPVTPTAVATR